MNEIRSECWCGSKLQSKLNGSKFCVKHLFEYMNKPLEVFKEPKQRIPKWSGRSKSPNRFNDYQ